MKKVKAFSQATFLWIIFSLVATMNNSLWGQLAPNSNWTKVISNPHPLEDGLWEDRNPEIEIVGNTIHFLWTSSRYADRGIVHYRNSTDGGKTLNPVRIIIDTIGNVNTCAGINNLKLTRMAVSGNNIHVTFQIRSSVYYSHSTNNGVSFSPVRLVYYIETGHNHDLTEPYISVLGDRVVIGFTETWYSSYMGAHDHDAGSAVISTDGGITFKAVAVSQSFKVANLRDVIQSGSKIHALIVDENSGYARVGISTSVDNGENFSLQWISDTSMTNKNSLECEYDNSYQPKIAVTGNYIYVVWSAIDRDEIAKLFICRSVNNGNTFETPIAIIDSTDAYYGDILGPSITIAAKGENVYVAAARGWGTAYLLKSTNGGDSFSSPVDMVSDGQIFQYYQKGKINPSIKFAPSDQTGKDVYYAMTNPKFRHSSDGFNTLGSIKIADLYLTKGYRDRTKLAVDQNGTAHIVYEYTFATGPYAERWIYYCNIPISQPAPSTANNSLLLDYDTPIGRFDNMQIPSTPELCFKDALTVEMWVKPMVGSGNNQTIILKDRYVNDGVNRRDCYGIYTENSSAGRKPVAILATTDDDNYAYTIRALTGIEDSVWNHLAMTYDANAGENNFKLYLNGNLVASSTVSGNISPYQFESPIWLGGSVRSSSQEYAGEVDELRFWKRALTNEEIATNMNKELVGNENGLVAYYNFNNTTKDITGNGNDGILMYQEAFVPSNPVGIKEASNLPTSFALFQNYPNPFNPSTTIQYSLKESGKVDLAVYNLLGQKVISLVNEYQNPGNHVIKFNASRLASGIYIYQIRANNFSASKKLLLLK